jgi:hypothetical protein
MTIIELAYLTENKEFMAHAVCQKWIIRQFYGGINLQDLTWGLFRCSDYFKVNRNIDFSLFCNEISRLSSVLVSYFRCGFGLIFQRVMKLRQYQKKQTMLFDRKRLVFVENVEIKTKMQRHHHHQQQKYAMKKSQ